MEKIVNEFNNELRNFLANSENDKYDAGIMSVATIMAFSLVMVLFGASGHIVAFLHSNPNANTALFNEAIVIGSAVFGVMYSIYAIKYRNY